MDRLPGVKGFVIFDKLGAGGFGTTFLAEWTAHTSYEKKVALKILYDDVADIELCGVKEMQRIQSGCKLLLYVINILDVEFRNDPGESWIKKKAVVTEFLPPPWTTLHRHVMENGPVDPNTVIRYFQDIATAIQHMHANGIAHGDIQPNNFFLMPETGEVVTGDYSLVRNLNTAAGQETYFKRLGMGAKGYVAPEVRTRENPGDTQSDLYALGKLLFFLTTGVSPEVSYHLVQITAEDAVKSGAPRFFAPLIASATAIPPQDRIASMDAFMETLLNAERDAFARKRNPNIWRVD